MPSQHRDRELRLPPVRPVPQRHALKPNLGQATKFHGGTMSDGGTLSHGESAKGGRILAEALEPLVFDTDDRRIALMTVYFHLCDTYRKLGFR